MSWSVRSAVTASSCARVPSGTAARCRATARGRSSRAAGRVARPSPRNWWRRARPPGAGRSVPLSSGPSRGGQSDAVRRDTGVPVAQRAPVPARVRLARWCCRPIGCGRRSGGGDRARAAWTAGSIRCTILWLLRRIPRPCGRRFVSSRRSMPTPTRGRSTLPATDTSIAPEVLSPGWADHAHPVVPGRAASDHTRTRRADRQGHQGQAGPESAVLVVGAVRGDPFEGHRGAAGPLDHPPPSSVLVFSTLARSLGGSLLRYTGRCRWLRRRTPRPDSSRSARCCRRTALPSRPVSRPS